MSDDESTQYMHVNKHAFFVSHFFFFLQPHARMVLVYMHESGFFFSFFSHPPLLGLDVVGLLSFAFERTWKGGRRMFFSLLSYVSRRV